MTIRTIAMGIIRNARREIFIARRPADVHMGGFWEFPGGKVEPGETPEQALYRELREETGIDVECAQLLATTRHSFAEWQMAFYFYLVEQWRGTPCSNEGQPVHWCPQQALRADEFPPANAAIIRQLIADRGRAVGQWLTHRYRTGSTDSAPMTQEATDSVLMSREGSSDGAPSHAPGGRPHEDSRQQAHLAVGGSAEDRG